MSNKIETKDNKIEEKIKTNNVAENVDYNAKWKEVRENLVLQFKNHLEKTEHHKTMATKAQGAIEVGDQMYLQEEQSDS